MIQSKIAQILVTAATMNEATPQILEVICQEFNYELGELWCFDKEDQILKFENAWHVPSPHLEKFLVESRQFKFTRSRTES